MQTIEYCASNGRMRYNPEFHNRHGEPWTVKELIYLCSMYHSMKKRDLSLALGRTHGTVLTKYYDLKKSGEFEKYKKMGEKL